MSDLTTGHAWSSGETVTPEKMDDMVNKAIINDGAVTPNKLADGVAIPAGTILAFAMNSVPSGWLAANGAAVSRAAYSGLFAAISTVHGVGDGSLTFNLPDLRGYFVRGSGTNSDGAVSGAFGAKIADDLISHTHGIAGGTGTNGSWGALAGSGIGVLSSATGGTETRPKNVAILYCIKY